MKNIKVKLLHITPQEVVCEAVGEPRQNPNNTMALVKKVISIYGHESVAEHINMNFKIEGFSRLELQEHMRHRMASPTVKSTRHTIRPMLEDFGRLVPETEYLASLSEDEWLPMLDKYFVTPDFGDPVLEQIYHSFLSAEIMALKAAEKRTKNQDLLKYFLTEGLRSSMVWTVNMRSFMNFLELRTAKASHPEIRKVAELCKEAVMQTYASVFLN